ncbi:MAG: DNA repair protein RecN, partial [Actinomycetota bacterium]|nr:DNA repair protein RecN [Actinomycetota bacterium]
ELRREADLLAHGLAEIEGAVPRPGEDTELAAVSGRLAHADALRLAARAGHDALLGDADDPTGESADVLGLIGIARRAMQQQRGADPELDALGGRLEDLAALAGDLGAECGAYADDLDADPARLEQIEARRAVLAGLVRKYADGPDQSLAAVLSWAEQAQDRLAEIDVSDEAISALHARREAAHAEVTRLASVLSDRRAKAAGRLAAAVSEEFAGLAMSASRLTVRVQATELGPSGADEVQFLLQPHLDAPALPIARGASGGELSRVMLALEVCFAGTDPVPTMVFDEVDAGVGGRAAVEVGRRLARLSRGYQVIVVTHLAQVAAYADRHIVVDKHTGHGVTTSDVRTVTDEQRVTELARMLAGSDSATALEHAAELMRTAVAERAESRCETAGKRRR